MSSDPDTTFWAIIAGMSGTVVGVIITAIGHLFQSHASMAQLVDARIRILIEGYENRIVDLQEEIRRLEVKVDALTKTLQDERSRTGLGA